MVPAAHDMTNVSNLNQLINLQIPSGHAYVKNS